MAQRLGDANEVSLVLRDYYSRHLEVAGSTFVVDVVRLHSSRFLGVALS